MKYSYNQCGAQSYIEPLCQVNIHTVSPVDPHLLLLVYHMNLSSESLDQARTTAQTRLQPDHKTSDTITNHSLLTQQSGLARKGREGVRAKEKDCSDQSKVSGLVRTCSHLQWYLTSIMRV